MKPTKRMNIFSKRVWAFALLAAVAVASLATRRATAQVGQGEADGIIGSWRVTATVTSLQGIPPFPVLIAATRPGVNRT